MHKKRKQRSYDNNSGRHSEDGHDLSLFIQTHEADLVHGSQTTTAAHSLEVERHEGGQTKIMPGDGLIRWEKLIGQEIDDLGMSDHVKLGMGPQSTKSVSHEATEIWVDRYDARLLLEALPDWLFSSTFAEPSSPGGWTDLPSDAEDTFFFSADETEDYRREKRRRMIDAGREARLRALRAESGEDEVRDPKEEWGGSDEEPDDTQCQLMRRTASHVLASPNPAQLEMRILANHGADPRFAFLRGRWSRTWRLTKAQARSELEKKRMQDAEVKRQNGGGMGGLAGYGDSDGDDDKSEDTGTRDDAQETAVNDGGATSRDSVHDVPDDAVKAARRARAREWAEQRRASKKSPASQDGST